MTDFSQPTHAQDEVDFWRTLGAEDEPPEHEPPPEPEHALPNHFAWMDEQRRLAYTVQCGDCQQPAKQPCVRVGTSEPLRRFPAHISRLLAAKRAAA